jgi:cell division protein ZapD
MSETADNYPENFSENFSGLFKAEQTSAKKRVVYEHPLNERVRSRLRLEHLFEQVNYRLKSISTWDSRAAVEGLIKILDFIGRNDLKPDLMKDLERWEQEYTRLQTLPGVDQERLNRLLEKIRRTVGELAQLERQAERALNENPLINSVRQRSGIPGGTCDFDLPAYHFWLQRIPQQRQSELAEWLYTLEPLRTAIELSLYLVRNNADTSHEVAKEGVFQMKPDDSRQVFQLIRVMLPGTCPYYPEISGGKHRLTIRFFEYTHSRQRSEQTEQNVQFELCCCVV